MKSVIRIQSALRGAPPQSLPPTGRCVDRTRRRTRRPIVVAFALLAAALVTSGCGTSSTKQATVASASSGSHVTHYPVTIRDCHGSTTYTKAPSRIATLDDEVTDTLVAMGLTDKIVGVTKFETPSQEWPKDAATVAKLHTLAIQENYPSLETILARNADFVISAYPSAFSKAYGPATPARWKSLGVKPYQTVMDCGLYSNKPQYDFHLMYQDIHNLGVIFNRQDDAAKLIHRLQGRVAAAQAKAKAAGLGNYRIGQANGMTQSPGTMGVTTNNAIISQAGSTYAFVKQDTNPNVSMSWEQVVKDNPQVFWLLTDSGKSVAQMRHVLESNPQLRSVDAIQHHRYVPISYFSVGGVRAVDGVEQLVNGLIALKHSGNL